MGPPDAGAVAADAETGGDAAAESDAGIDAGWTCSDECQKYHVTDPLGPLLECAFLTPKDVTCTYRLVCS